MITPLRKFLSENTIKELRSFETQINSTKFTNFCTTLAQSGKVWYTLVQTTETTESSQRERHLAPLQKGLCESTKAGLMETQLIMQKE